jgi:hypothetical protein
MQQNLPATMKDPSHRRDYRYHNQGTEGADQKGRLAAQFLELVDFVCEYVPAIGASKAIEKDLRAHRVRVAINIFLLAFLPDIKEGLKAHCE